MANNNAFTRVEYPDIEAIGKLQVKSKVVEGAITDFMDEFKLAMADHTKAEIIAALPPGNGEEPANVLKDAYTAKRDLLAVLNSNYSAPAWDSMP